MTEKTKETCMTKKITIAVVLALVCASTVSADIKKGQKAYLKQCKKCHGNGTKGSSMKSQEEWTAAFENEAALFKEWHAGTKGEKYTKSKKFKRSAEHLKDFLHQYANDSGNVPSCG